MKKNQKRQDIDDRYRVVPKSKRDGKNRKLSDSEWNPIGEPDGSNGYGKIYYAPQIALLDTPGSPDSWKQEE